MARTTRNHHYQLTLEDAIATAKWTKRKTPLAHMNSWKSRSEWRKSGTMKRFKQIKMQIFRAKCKDALAKDRELPVFKHTKYRDMY